MSRSSEFFRKCFTFTPSQRRGILWLLPLLAVAGALVVFANRPCFDPPRARFDSPPADNAEARHTEGVQSITSEPELFAFDPNTVTLQELCRLGFTQRTAAGIIRYREAGKRFSIPEDFATCYGVSLDEYTRLEPYIIIGEQFRQRGAWRGSNDQGERPTRELTPVAGHEPFDPNLLGADGFTGLGFSPAQAAVIVKYRASIGGFRSAEDFAKCYVVSDRKMEELLPYIRIGETGVDHPAEETAERPRHRPLVDINTADSATLRTVNGIGEKLVVRIVDYRARLGGYARKEQLLEIPGMYEENFVRIAEQIFADSCIIRKIDVNFASPKELTEALERHPYISREGLRKLLKNRQLKGGWRTIGDMADENIVTQEQAARLGLYLIFRNE